MTDAVLDVQYSTCTMYMYDVQLVDYRALLTTE